MSRHSYNVRYAVRMFAILAWRGVRACSFTIIHSDYRTFQGVEVGREVEVSDSVSVTRNSEEKDSVTNFDICLSSDKLVTPGPLDSMHCVQIQP